VVLFYLQLSIRKTWKSAEPFPESQLRKHTNLLYSIDSRIDQVYTSRPYSST